MGLIVNEFDNKPKLFLLIYIKLIITKKILQWFLYWDHLIYFSVLHFLLFYKKKILRDMIGEPEKSVEIKLIIDDKI